jgi:hypothetical protein
VTLRGDFGSIVMEKLDASPDDIGSIKYSIVYRLAGVGEMGGQFFLYESSVKLFEQSLSDAIRSLDGVCELASVEEDFSLTVSVQRGKVRISGRFEFEDENSLEFSFDSDQSFFGV